MKPPIDSKAERWNDVPGFEGIYLGSTQGRVFAHARVVERSNGTTRRLPARYLTGNRRTGQFHLSWDGEQKMLSPQAVVLMIFVRGGEVDEVATVIDESRGPILGNVEWRTHSDFRAEKCKTSGPRKLSAKKVARIRSHDISTTAKTQALAERLGLHRNSVYRIARGETWPEVQVADKAIAEQGFSRQREKERP